MAEYSFEQEALQREGMNSIFSFLWWDRNRIKDWFSILSKTEKAGASIYTSMVGHWCTVCVSYLPETETIC